MKPKHTSLHYKPSTEYVHCSSASDLTFDDKTGFWSPRKKQVCRLLQDCHSVTETTRSPLGCEVALGVKNFDANLNLNKSTTRAARITFSLLAEKPPVDPYI